MLRIALATSLSLSSVLFVSDVMAAERVINVIVSVDGKAKPDPPFTGTRPAVDVAILPGCSCRRRCRLVAPSVSL